MQGRRRQGLGRVGGVWTVCRRVCPSSPQGFWGAGFGSQAAVSSCHKRSLTFSSGAFIICLESVGVDPSHHLFVPLTGQKQSWPQMLCVACFLPCRLRPLRKERESWLTLKNAAITTEFQARSMWMESAFWTVRHGSAVNQPD